MKALSPDEVFKKKNDAIPELMVQAVNNLLVKKYKGSGTATIKQKHIVEEFHKLTNNSYSDNHIHDNNWLDFEPIFEEVGWNVNYDKPGYNESYDAYFEFSKSKHK